MSQEELDQYLGAPGHIGLDQDDWELGKTLSIFPYG